MRIALVCSLLAVFSVAARSPAPIPGMENPMVSKNFYLICLRTADHEQKRRCGRYEPQDSGENRAALRAVADMRWTDYPYTVIVVPGAGGADLTTRLSPFVLVSGGHVHPNQTPFAEATEMKRVLIQDFALPESAIIVNPHARHTTTNVRNATRLMFRYGIPLDCPALVTSDAGQSAYIEQPMFAERCRKELGYVPYRLGKRLSRFDQEFYALIESLHADNSDPLDP